MSVKYEPEPVRAIARVSRLHRDRVLDPRAPDDVPRGKHELLEALGASERLCGGVGSPRPPSPNSPGRTPLVRARRRTRAPIAGER